MALEKNTILISKIQTQRNGEENPSATAMNKEVRK